MFPAFLAGCNQPTPAPSAGVFDSPTVCLSINSEWAGYVAGAIGHLLNPACWQGSIDEKWDAVQGIESILLALSQIGACEVALIGEIRFMATENAPNGWLICDGSAISRADYADLFSALGVLWGSGDGLTTFNIPDMRGRSPMGAGQPYDNGQTMGLGALYGEQSHTLTAAEMPIHSHQQTNNVPLPAYRHSGVAGAQGSMAFTNGTTNTGQELRTQTTGGGEAHNNIHPVLVGNFIIYAGV